MASESMASVNDVLAEMTPEEIQAVKEKIGLKAFRQKFLGMSSHCQSGSRGPKARENKNRPMEMSSRRRVPLPTVQKEKVIRDPRFDDACGTYRPEIFDRDYAFISDLKANEKQKVIKQLKKEKNDKKKQKLKQILNKMKQEEQTREEKEKKNSMMQEWKEKEKERVKDGKSPYFLKKSDIRKLELAEKFKTLKEKGQVKRVIERKRKRKAQKERKNVQQAKRRTD